MTARNKNLCTAFGISILCAAIGCASFSDIPLLQNSISLKVYAADDSLTAASAEDASSSETVVLADGTESSYSISADLSDERKELLLTALSLEGQISYTWGGKATTTGWNARWSTGTGLDCSGFVQWAYWTALGIRNGLGSTLQISGSFTEIKEEELKPGDLGLLYQGGSGYAAEDGTVYETEAEASEANMELARKSVKRQLKGKEKITLNACKKAKKAAQAYQKAKKSAGGTEAAQAAEYEEKAANALAQADALISEAEEYESLAAGTSSAVTAQSVTSLSVSFYAQTDTDTSTDDTDNAADSGSSADSDAADSDSSNTDTQEAASDSSSSDSESGESSSAESSSSDSASQAEAYSAKAAALRTEAAALTAQAESWQEKAGALYETSKSKQAAAKVKLSKLKKKAAIARSKAVAAVYQSYTIEKEANHVGIYVGTDENGNALWVHCNATHNTVTVDGGSGFTYFVRVITDEHYTTAGDESSVKNNKKGLRLIEQAIARHKLFLLVPEELMEEEPLTAKAEEQAALCVYAESRNA